MTHTDVLAHSQKDLGVNYFFCISGSLLVRLTSIEYICYIMFSKLPRYFDSVAQRGYEGDKSQVQLITADEAKMHQMKFIESWEPKEETRAFRYSAFLLGALASVTGAFLQNHYRSVFQLKNFGIMSTYLPAAALPGMMNYVFQNQFVTLDILTGRTPCPVCLQIRSATYQFLLGVVYPMVLTPVAAAFIAGKYYTYPVPELRQYKSVIDLWKKTTYPLRRPIAAITAFHILGAVIATYKQGEAMDKLQDKIWGKQRMEAASIQETEPFTTVSS